MSFDISYSWGCALIECKPNQLNLKQWYSCFTAYQVAQVPAIEKLDTNVKCTTITHKLQVRGMFAILGES